VPHESHETHEESAKGQENPVVSGNPHENEFFIEAGKLTPEKLQAAVRLVTEEAAKKKSFGSALRGLAMLGEEIAAEKEAATKGKSSPGNDGPRDLAPHEFEDDPEPQKADA